MLENNRIYIGEYFDVSDCEVYAGMITQNPTKGYKEDIQFIYKMTISPLDLISAVSFCQVRMGFSFGVKMTVDSRRSLE